MNKPKIILQRLNECGFDAYIVGGAVRDFLLGLVPKDYDIATNASMEAVEACFEKTKRTGEKYGTVSVFIEGESFEVTTFRSESDYDGRAPRAVAFVKTLYEDLSRRDFTINAMAMDRCGKIYDYFGGRNDLEKGLIRFVGNPEKRLEEDRLRIFRMVRFAQRYGFDLIGVPQCRVDISPVSLERIQKEFNEILISKQPSRGIKMLHQYGVLEQFLPEIIPLIGFDQKSPHHLYDVFEHTMKALDVSSDALVVRLAVLFHDIGKPMTFSVDDLGNGHFFGHEIEGSLIAEKILKRLHYDAKTVDCVYRMIRYHMIPCEEMKKVGIRKLLRQISPEEMPLFLEVIKADRLSTSHPALDTFFAFKERIGTVLDEKPAFSVKDLEVDGYDLMAMGYSGKQIGLVLNSLLDAVVEERVLNEKSMLILYLKGQSISN